MRRGRPGGDGRRDYNAASVAANGKGLLSPVTFAVPFPRREPRFWIHFSESIIEIVVATSRSQGTAG